MKRAAEPEKTQQGETIPQTSQNAKTSKKKRSLVVLWCTSHWRRLKQATAHGEWVQSWLACGFPHPHNHLSKGTRRGHKLPGRPHFPATLVSCCSLAGLAANSGTWCEQKNTIFLVPSRCSLLRNTTI